jgi:hypothetical protein
MKNRPLIYSNLCSFVIYLLVSGSSFAQKTAVIQETNTPIIVDGIIESSWNAATSQSIERIFQLEHPSVTATWQALWDLDNFYLVVSVEDDNHWPSWEKAGANAWEYDKLEVYIDVNKDLLDERGPSAAFSGHYQAAPDFAEADYDVKKTLVSDGRTTPGGIYAFHLSNENYVFEYAFKWSDFFDSDGIEITPEIFLTRPMGFDVCVVDQDEGITIARNRMYWSQDGKTNVLVQAWDNMDDAGNITFNSTSDFLNISSTTVDFSAMEVVILQ